MSSTEGFPIMLISVCSCCQTCVAAQGLIGISRLLSVTLIHANEFVYVCVIWQSSKRTPIE